MRSSLHTRSAHMADLTGKGILYEDDDEPIKLTEQDDSQVIKEFRMSPIGKVLNPKKQNVEKLLQSMPTQWGLQDRITANDLGKGKFLFNFTTEEDLMSLLQKGPFHYNYCMFVLVRWEPVVHDDYPWIIPFWVQLYGLPLHLWTVTNLKNIGSRIGHVDVDSIELTEGRMRIEVDSRRPLKFKRKVESPDAEEVTIEIKYDMLFKHCTTCGLMSHEEGYCPTMEPPARVSSERGGVFTRVQIPQVRNTRQPSLNEYNQLSLQRDAEPAHNGAENREMASRWSAPRNQTMVRGRYPDDHAYQNRNTGAGDQFRSHYDRIIRRRDERHSGNREAARLRLTMFLKNSCRVINKAGCVQRGLKMKWRLRQQEDMEILDTNNAGMMEFDVQDDDLLADEVREMDEKARHSHVAASSNVMLAQRNKKSSRSGAKRSAPLGIQSREREILRQVVQPVVQDNISEVDQAISLGNICLLDGSWTSSAHISGCGWVWMDSAENTQLMGTKNFTRLESALHSEVEALRWAMENMLQYSTCQRFGTDCKELIAMIKDPHAWPSFATELERIETLQICFPEFSIIHVPRARNQISDFLAKTARSFHRELFFIGCSIPV
ncbi:hypothetical protein DY000_02008667 [Brassica cretica]|uniref:DUF4283 domain-containing protein n=1 Tax=Brassica cretica TaxID=69181 RepID=A0ABQ7C9X2_BRACR|nr:hypothetical protein DY000_02008667 [Brassica cretica]